MKALEDKILSEGKVLKGNIFKSGRFLNHQLDVNFFCLKWAKRSQNFLKTAE